MPDALFGTMKLFGRKDIAWVTMGFLLLELVSVTVAMVLLTKVLRTDLNSRYAWFTVPSLLIAAAVIPTVSRRRSLADVGLRMGRLGPNLRVLCISCLVLTPILLGCVLLFKHYHLQLPLCPVVPEKQWFSWLTYQFMYVATAEEFFFRGYLQSNILRLLNITTHRSVAFLELMSVVISAIVFAVFHSLVLGSLKSTITFFPGLIFGWLFVKTKSLLVPILFHGLANTGYGFIAAVLT